VNPGEEILTFEPFFPPYVEHSELAQGVLKSVPLELSENGNQWVFNPDKLRKAITPKTKVFILNNAHNPTGKIFAKEELEQISDILKAYPNVIVIADEVYEFLVYDKTDYTYFANIGENFKRTISVFSGGKLFNATGWKVGWSIGPKELLKNASVLTNTVFYCFNSVGQIAMARSLDSLEKFGYK